MSYNLIYNLINNGTAYEIDADYDNATGELVDLIIPATYQGLPVISIASSAFTEWDDLSSVVIPDSVRTIGTYAFAYCRNLYSAALPDSLAQLGDSAFCGCTALTNVNIPTGISQIEFYTFQSCNIQTIVIPSNVTIIGDYAFRGCTSLTSVTIPNSVTSIGNSAFESCDSLTSIVIPDSVTTIGYGVFYDCTNLKSIILLNKTPISININCFIGISTSSKFYCYYSAIEKYKTATNWNTYADRFIADDMRLYFTMNARAQKKYFATKAELNTKPVVAIYTWGEND